MARYGPRRGHGLENPRTAPWIRKGHEMTKSRPFVSSLPPTKKGRGRPRKIRIERILGDPNAPDPLTSWISEEAFAQQRGLSIVRLRAERRRADGPPFMRDGRKIFYNAQGFRDWLARKGAPGELDDESP
jgi:hypothetical protein